MEKYTANRRVKLREITYYCLQGPGEVLYVGKAMNLSRRLYEHRLGRGSKVTRTWDKIRCIESISLPYINEADSRRVEKWYRLFMQKKYPGKQVCGS